MAGISEDAKQAAREAAMGARPYVSGPETDVSARELGTGEASRPTIGEPPVARDEAPKDYREQARDAAMNARGLVAEHAVSSVSESELVTGEAGRPEMGRPEPQPQEPEPEPAA